ncbi:hypothetical protein ccbrp13_05540 [Ktedonobacteria bacterium brp13]|nr:hypothetical protein ccbrp13_05540 [Ktedonobacteria bacterium brp13]
MEKSTKAKDNSPNGELIRQLLLLAPLLPTAAVLLVGAYGTQRMAPEHMLSFVIFFLLCALAIFVATRKVMSMLQSTINKPYEELTNACRELLQGNEHKGIVPPGGREVKELAKVINALLEKQVLLAQQAAPSPLRSMVTSTQTQSNEAALLNQQLTTLLSELTPVVSGDLRVKTSVPKGYVGVVADTCNSFIEELAQFVRWTRYASQQVTSSSRGILDRSIEMTRTIETEMHRLSTTTQSVEEIVAFVQRLSNTLQLSVDIAQELQTQLNESGTGTYMERTIIRYSTDATPLAQLTIEAQRQTELLEETLSSTTETSIRAEALIGELYAVAQHLHHSSVDILRTAERINELEQLAERWNTAAEAFTIADIDEDGGASKQTWLL